MHNISIFFIMILYHAFIDNVVFTGFSKNTWPFNRINTNCCNTRKRHILTILQNQEEFGRTGLLTSA